MNDFLFFTVAFGIYFLSMVGYFFFVSSKKEVLGRWSSWGTGIGLIFHTIAIIIRFGKSGFAPMTNMYESLSFLVWVLVFAFLIFERIYSLRSLGAVVLPVVFALMAFASSPIIPKDVTPLVPALQSYWLALHVSFSLIGYAFFAIASGVGVIYLLEERFNWTKFSSSKLDDICYKAVAVGFPIFTLGGLIFGAIWAQKAWGRYWGWDPKEVWTLITWVVFALYLHTRLTWGWKGKRSAWIAVVGFVAALFTYFGVNYLLSGLHSYG